MRKSALCCLFFSRLNMIAPVQGNKCTRWIVVGTNPGAMYWLEPGTPLRSRPSVVFSGVHSMEQPVYFLPQDILPDKSVMAIAMLVSQPVTREMTVECSGREPIRSLQTAMKRISNVRILSFQAETNSYIYHGVWMITAIDHRSEDQAAVTMYNMPG